MDVFAQLVWIYHFREDTRHTILFKQLCATYSYSNSPLTCVWILISLRTNKATKKDAPHNGMNKSTLMFALFARDRPTLHWESYLSRVLKIGGSCSAFCIRRRGWLVQTLWRFAQSNAVQSVASRDAPLYTAPRLMSQRFLHSIFTFLKLSWGDFLNECLAVLMFCFSQYQEISAINQDELPLILIWRLMFALTLWGQCYELTEKGMCATCFCIYILLWCLDDHEIWRAKRPAHPQQSTHGFCTQNVAVFQQSHGPFPKRIIFVSFWILVPR